jgi:hydrogenase nickel incorporation protein HypB
MHRTRVRVVEGVLGANDTIARANRVDFDAADVTVVNLMGAPGSGRGASTPTGSPLSTCR